MNDADEVVGTAVARHTTMYWKPGTELRLGSSGAIVPDPRINADGLVAFTQGTPTALQRAFTWRAGVYRDLGALDPGPNSYARAVNNGGEVVGASFPLGFLSNGALTALDKTRRLDPRDLNDRTQIVGGEEGASGFGPFLWEGGTLYPLPPDPSVCLSPGCEGQALAINNRGTIAAVTYTAGRPTVAYLLHDRCRQPSEEPPPPEEPTE